MDPNAPVLVDPRIVRRVIRQQRELEGLGIHVPHEHCAAATREDLLRWVSAKELGQPAASLPDEVVLVAREEEVSARTLWQRNFHGRVHLALARKQRQGELSVAAVRARINAIGQTEFDEIRAVLRQEDLVASVQDDVEVYVEFAATYLEYRWFDPERILRVFPTLTHHEQLLATLALDVDGAHEVEVTRPAGERALELAPVTAHEGDEPAIETHAPDVTAPLPPERALLRKRAELARSRGNLVRAAIASRRASLGEPAEVPAEVREMGQRIARMLGHAEGAEAWAESVGVLVDTAASRSRLSVGREARLLFDLQRAWRAHEEVSRTVDVVGWLVSFGQRAVVRELPVARLVNVVRHLRRAQVRAARVRVETAARRALQARLVEALHRADERLRAGLGPKIQAALEAVGLVPRHAPERVALRKLVGELLDQAATHGFLTISHLRDAIARSNLKLGDLRGPGEWLRGDALLKADERLSVELDGVYRRGEAYLRALQRTSSLFFGTAVGRAVTLHLIVPLLVAFVALEGLQHLVGPLGRHLFHTHGHIHLLTPWTFGGTALLLYGMLHSAWFRDRVVRGLRALGHGLWALLVGVPRWVLTRAPVQALLRSPLMRLGWRYVLKPSLVVVPLYVLLATRLPLWQDVGASAALFALLTLALNTSAGLAAQEQVAVGATRSWRFVSHQVLPGLVALIGELSQRLLDGVDRVLYAVDERLRFRQSDSRLSMVAKGALGTVWFFVTYLLRLFVNVLFEPQINPIKHFPVVTVSHKVLLPMTPSLRAGLLSVGLENATATSIAATTILLLPGAVGFLVWELKGNWDLYARNRSATLKPVLVGHHGETLKGLLKPGFHSGTVPKLYARMRRAIRQGNDRAGKYREQLRDVEHAVHSFVARELCALLEESEAWSSGPVRVAEVGVGSNRLRVALACPAVSSELAWLHFEEQSGWVVSQVAQRGWIAQLDDRHRDLFEAALAGLYRLAGVDICREQLQASLTGAPPYDVSDEGLIVWPGGDYQTEVIYPLVHGRRLLPHTRGKAPPVEPPSLDGDELLLMRQPLPWLDWLTLWAKPSTPVPSLRRGALL